MLRDYLRARGLEVTAQWPRMRVLSGGVSNRAVWVTWPSGEAWVMKQALAKLRVAVDWFSSPERIHREALGLRWLAELAPPGVITPLIFEDHEQHVLAMQAVPLPHENWKTMLLAGTVSPDHARQFGQLLGTVHRASHDRAGEFAPIFDDTSFFESLRLEPYYLYTATQVPEAADFLNHLVDDTRARRRTIVHGDYSPKNVLVHQDRLVLLDHEVIHWGDPGFDAGFSLTHLLSKAHHLPQHRDQFGQAAALYWTTYRALAGDLADEARAVRHTLACLLARVCGRSPLEYMDATERARQRAAVVSLLAAPPHSVDQLIKDFLACL